MERFEFAIEAYVSRVREGLDLLDTTAVRSLALALFDALERQVDVYVFGNGGSAAAASHLTVDLAKGACAGTPRRFRVHCLNDNVPTMTALANDIAYDHVFVEPLRNLLRPGDLVIAFSGSGNSPNVVRAVEYARELGATVAGITGFDGGRLKVLADISIHLPLADMQVAEDMQLVVTHALMRTLGAHLGADGC